MRDRLRALDEAGKPIRVAVIGCGRFGSMMLGQIRLAPGMEVAVACDMDGEKARATLGLAGYKPGVVVGAGRVSEANEAIERGTVAVTEDPEVAVGAQVDVVVEATGNPDAGARYAFQAIEAGKHVVMVNVEADVLVGPVLKEMADEAGVVYSLAYGDQPAIIEELYDWATTLGFEVVAAGKGTKYLPEYRQGTPEQALLTYGYSEEEAAMSGLNPRMYNSFLDGTKSAIEMCAVSNMTGLVPDVPGMHFPPSGVSELPNLLRPESDGGILSRKGVVEIVSSLRRDGSEIADSLRWGVYVVLTTESRYLRTCLAEYGLAMDESETYGLMYRPYHLVGMEAPVSIAKAALYNEPTGAPRARVGEVVAVAKRGLMLGEVLDGEGGETVYGSLVEAAQATAEGLVPIGFCNGASVTKQVASGRMLTKADVKLPRRGFARQLLEQHA